MSDYGKSVEWPSPPAVLLEFHGITQHLHRRSARARDCPLTSSNFIRITKELKNKDQYSQVLFSGFVRMLNWFNNTKDRALLITDKHIYRLEPKKHFKVQKRIPIDTVNSLSVTSGADQMVALHTASQEDVLVFLQRGQLGPTLDRVGELVGNLCDHFTRVRKTNLPVKVCSRGLQVNISGKPKTITVETRPGQNMADFKKSRGGFTLLLPPS
ncbi:unconventional myosin-Id-like [Hoplias malabaricus]|uniref:unconventional myosin-Id-like n=1 Tax=Hoplias malabaricus TaxID=27720 RepID=UPI0034618469